MPDWAAGWNWGHIALDGAVVAAAVALSAFFSGAETALTAASRARMHALEQAGDRRAVAVNRLLDRRERLIGAMLIGGQFVNIAASAFLTGALLSAFGGRGELLATAIMTVLIVLFAEIAPKTLAVLRADSVALAVAGPARVFVALFSPLLFVAERVTRALLAPLGAAAPLVSGSEEIMGAVELVHREGGVARGERDMVGGLLDLSELAVSDVMVHRTRMRAIDADLPPHEIVREALASPHTRHPLWRGARDNIVGVLHARDLLRALDAAGGDASKVDAATIAAPPWFVPESTDLKTQLEAFLRRKAHFALVVDEYGEVMGLVTLEDILEEIVGDIKDEHDPAVQGVKAQQDGSIMVEGATPIRDVNRAMGWTLPDSEATTMAGLVIHEARAIPEPGQAFTFHGFRFHVLRRTRNRITLLRVAPIRERAKGATAR